MQLLKSRTVWFAILLAMAGVAQPFVVQMPMPPWAQAVVSCLLAGAIVLLRLLTTQPIDEK